MDKTNCDRCGQLSTAHYVESVSAKGLRINCKKCGKHYGKYTPNLKITKYTKLSLGI